MRVRDVPLVGWVSYLPLLGVLAALLAAVCGLGQMLGAPSLIWHDDGLTQLLAGLAAAALCAHLGMIGYLLDSRENPNPKVAPGAATFGNVAGYLLWPVGALALAVGGAFFWQGQTRHHGAGVPVAPLAAVAILTWLARGRLANVHIAQALPPRLRELLVGAVVRQHARASAQTPAPPLDPGAHAVQAVLMGALSFVYGAICATRLAVPAAVAVGVALSLATGVWGLLRFWMRRFRLVGLALLALVLFVAGTTRDAPVTGLAHIRLPSADSPARPLLSDEATLAAWKRGLGEDKPPLVVVTTSGGASRAALWTINVLASLDRGIPGFLRHVRLVTGASGGMVGAGHLVAALGPTGLTVPIERVLADAAKDSLTAITRALILPGQDRGRALEDAWERNTDGRLAVPVTALAAGEAAGWRPTLVFTPMLIESGRRLFVSNLDLSALTVAPGPGLECATPADCAQSISAVQLLACSGEGLDALKLSTAARLSSTYPWVVSAALLGTNPDRRVVDAGYYDNYGVDVATAWIRKNAAWLAAETSGVLLLRLRDGPDDGANLGVPPGPGYFHEWISAFTTPIEGLLSARNSSMSFRNDGEVTALAADPRLRPGTHFFATATVAFSGDAPLEWYLDELSIARLEQPPDPQELARIAAWWSSRRP